MEKAVRAIISGRVQGVAYRYWTQGEAQRRQLRGMVRNRRDGSVEAIFLGDADEVDSMLIACESGPPMAVVDSVQCEPVDELEGYTGFDIGITF